MHRCAPPIPDCAYALLLDFDGSLVELAPSPECIHLPSRLPQLLIGLHQQLQGAIACISGRSYADLHTWLGNTGIDLAGSHGAELCRPLPPDPSWAMWAQQCAHTLQSHWPQILVEAKPHGMAIHWRQCPEAQERVLAWIADHLPLWPQHMCTDGKCVAEIRLARCDKGHAVQHLMRQPAYAERLPIYVGDDTTDLAAFAAVQSMGGWAIAIGHKTASKADFFLPHPQACRTWLQQLMQLQCAFSTP